MIDLNSLSLPYELRPYQKDGVDFLFSNKQALLADDMGLGKTVQTIVALKYKYEREGIFRCLIVVPNSLLSNWVREFNIWFPESMIHTVEGDAKNRLIQLERTNGFLLASYEQIRIAYEQPNKVPPFEVVVLDEVQKIKNRNSKVTLSCNLIKKNSAWILSGTPLENNSNEIITVFSFLKRGLLVKDMANSVIKETIASYMLRRLKKDILPELPELIEQDVYLDLSSEQRSEYEKIYESRFNRNPLEVITELKKICNFSDSSNYSIKMERLNEICEELEYKGEKIIVFSQYVKSLEKIQKNFKQESCFLYHGGLDKNEKDNIINKFKEVEGHAVLLMSLHAGSVGLNLQQASTVVLFDRWWNPAVEDQAIARAHRMGRKGSVHAIKFLTKDTIEEKINRLLIEKSDLFDDVVEGAVEVRNKIKLKELLEI